jgi:hypothetical protein
MSCLSEERFIHLLDRGGLEAAGSDDEFHLNSCDACRETWASIAAAGDVLAEAKPKTAGRATRWVPLAVAAAMLLAILAAIALRPTPSRDPVARFVDGTPEEARSARAELLKLGRNALPGLVAARPRLQGKARLAELQSLVWDLKSSSMRQDPEDLALVRKLETLKLDIAFSKTRFEDVLHFIRDWSGVNMVLDPALNPGIVEVLRLERTSLREVLDILCAVEGLEFDFRYKVVFVSSPLRLWSTDPKIGVPLTNCWRAQAPDSDPTARKLHTIRITADMQNAPLSACCEYMNEVGGTKVRADPSIVAELITMKVVDLPLDHVLELLTLLRGWDVRIEGGEVLIFARGQQ